MSPTTFLPMDVPRRAQRARALLAAEGIDAMVVTSLVNISWLTGFTASNAVVLLTDTGLVVFTDGRYGDQAPAQLAAAGVSGEVVVGNDLLGALVAQLGSLSRLGLEPGEICWADQQKLAAECSAEVVAMSAALVELRAVKDGGEIDRVRHAARIADGALASVAPMLGEGATEREVALELDHDMRVRGATTSAYETIVASGPNAALPHARPGNRLIRPGDLVIIDVGALVGGYRSDMTRSFVVGEPTEAQRRHLDVVREAQAAGVAAVSDGVAARRVDDACRSVIADAGWADHFTHGTGHGVGLDIHELPRVNSRTTDVLTAGMVVTVEPGVYFPGQGGVRWEDLLVVTASGAEVLTTSPKEARV